MELRGYREGDLEALAKLGTLAFGMGAYWEDYYDPEKNPRLDPSLVYVIEEDGEPRASVTVLPMEAFVDGEPVAMGGIAAVNAHPAYRRRGYAGKLMREAIGGMRERGMSLSMLHPFSHTFYRAHGWELATEAIKYELSPTEIPTSAEQRRVRAYDDAGGADLPRMTELFESWAATRPCSVRRGEGRWLQVLGRKDQEAAVYEAENGTLEGYLLYAQSEGSGGPPNTLDVSELVASTPAAREALVSFMGAYDPRMYSVKLSVQRGEPLHPYLPDAQVRARLEPEFMLRLVDVEGALNGLRRSAEPLVLDVSDDVIPENSGSYTLGDGGVTRGVEAEARVKLDVRRLAQLYAGYLPAGQMSRYGFVEPGSPGALELLEAWFPVGDPYVSVPDHF